MSMRACFTTEFIYDGSKGYQDRGIEMCKVLDVPCNISGGNMIGQIAGILSGLDLAENDIRTQLEDQAIDLCKITLIPFKIVYLLEGGDIVVKEIFPMGKKHD